MLYLEHTTMNLTRFLKSQGFTLALIGAVLAAIIMPDLGVKGGPLKTELTTKIAVALTFLIQGLSLPTRQIARSAAKVRLHLFCQVCNFVAAPLLMLGLLFLVQNWIHSGIHSGFIYLAVLPTTISSAIVLTSNSDGDSSAALFSTTLSNILGVLVTPLLCALLLETSSSNGASLGGLIAKLSLLVLLPIVVGQAIRPLFREWVAASKALFKKLSNAFIVFIVYAAFSNSVKNGIWTEIGLPTVMTTLLLALVFLLIFSTFVWLSAPLATANRPERIAAFFCGSQKTLASGVPMASVIFAQSQTTVLVGLLILPLMCYHPMQLFLGGALTPFLTQKAQK